MGIGRRSEGAVMSARDASVAIIEQEHRALDMVLRALQHLVADIVEQHLEPDFALLAAALYYIDDFPERFHHPKEDKYLFKALRRRTTQFNAVLDELQAEHIRSAQMTGYLQSAFVHYQGRAPHGIKPFSEAVDAYAAMLREHMRKEEELLAQPEDYLTEEDWREIAAAFDANDDPLFGEHQREEFRKLYFRIVNLLPSKMRIPKRRIHNEQ
jgi:hemerythrin-like domain-containing protein